MDGFRRERKKKNENEETILETEREREKRIFFRSDFFRKKDTGVSCAREGTRKILDAIN